jgi:hypothetical protein
MQYAEPTNVPYVVAIERLKVRKCQMAASRVHRPLVSIFEIVPLLSFVSGDTTTSRSEMGY